METFKVMLGNLWTTVTGLVAGAVYYLATSGATIPGTKEELKSLLVSATLFALGLTSKSATTGSRPGGAS